MYRPAILPRIGRNWIEKRAQSILFVHIDSLSRSLLIFFEFQFVFLIIQPKVIFYMSFETKSTDKSLHLSVIYCIGQITSIEKWKLPVTHENASFCERKSSEAIRFFRIVETICHRVILEYQRLQLRKIWIDEINIA